MSLAKRRVRWVGVGVSCLVSVGLGLALVFRVVTPQTLSRVQTPELLAMMGLLVMPGLAAWTIHTERRVRLKKAREAEALAAAQTLGIASKRPPAAHTPGITELKPAAVSPWLNARPASPSPAGVSGYARDYEPQRPLPGRHAETPAADASLPPRQAPHGLHAAPIARAARGRRPGRPALHTGTER